MRTALTVIDDGRPEYLRLTIDSLHKHLPFTTFNESILINDTGSPEYASYLRAEYPEFTRQIHHETRHGLAGAVQSAWTAALDCDVDWIWHNEDDVPLLADIDIVSMAEVLAAESQLAQLMLMRPPFNAAEMAAGGVYWLTPDEFYEQTDGMSTWTEHSRWYGFQPHLARRSVIEYIVNHATSFLELGVTEVLKPAGFRFGYWGGMNDAPLCDHIGIQRSSGYRW